MSAAVPPVVGGSSYRVGSNATERRTRRTRFHGMVVNKQHGMRINTSQQWRQYECSLHRSQARARLLVLSLPACCRATMCSTWKGISGVAFCGIRQYSHRSPARCHTNSRVVASILLGWILGKELASLRLNDRNHVNRFDEILVLGVFFWR